MQSLQQRINQFNKDRDWDQFHSPVNLTKSIVIEAAELLENFQWDENTYDLGDVSEELADILIYCFQLADRLGLDIQEIMMKKLEKNENKYPISKAKGSSLKYTEFGE